MHFHNIQSCNASYNEQQQQQQQQQHPFNGPLSEITLVRWYEKGKTNLDLLEKEIVNGSGISWAICKSAPCPRQITMPAPITQFLQAR